MISQAKADISALIPSYKSKTEEDWAVFGGMILDDELGQRTNKQVYEPIIFNLPGGKYTPDFYHILSDGRIVFVEVKATKKMQSYRDSRAKLRAAAALYPEFTWIMALRNGLSWELEVI